MDRKKIKIITASVIVALLCSICFYIFFINLFIDPFINISSREFSNINFYNKFDKSDKCNSVFFIGNSQIMESVDANVIDQYFKNATCINSYNLGTDGDTPLRRLLELNSIINQKPKLVIIGTSFTSLEDFAHNYSDDDPRLYTLYEKITLDNYSKSLFQEKNVTFFKRDIFTENFEKRVYIKQFFGEQAKNYFFKPMKNIFKITDEKDNIQNFKNPYGHFENISYETLVNRVNPDKGSPNEKWLFSWITLYSNDNPQKKALLYTIEKLKSNNIRVIVINMPLNPLLSEKITNTTRENYYSFFNSSDIQIYDYEKQYPANHFIDETHLNVVGREKFSNEMIKIISEEMKIK